MATDRPQTWTERKLALTSAWSSGRRVVIFTAETATSVPADDMFSCTVIGLGNGMASVDRSFNGPPDLVTLREEEIVGIEPVEAVKPRRIDGPGAER